MSRLVKVILGLLAVLVAALAVLMITRAWVSSTAAALDAELTRNVLRARVLRAESGAWPRRAVASTVCAGARWSHELAPDETLMIALDRTFPAFESLPKPFRLGQRSGSSRRTKQRTTRQPLEHSRTGRLDEGRGRGVPSQRG